MAGLAEIGDDVKFVEVAVVVFKLEDCLDVQFFQGGDPSNAENVMINLLRNRQSLQ